MDVCSKCGKVISKDWNYCHHCGEELAAVSQAFAYEQLFELMKLEESRKEYLDSKASTYIGLLSIAVSVLTAFGGILAIRGGQIQEIKNLEHISTWVFVFIYIIYYSIITLFMISVLFAFRAYATGSKEIQIKSKNGRFENKLSKRFIDALDSIILPSKDQYCVMPIRYIATNEDRYLFVVRKELIQTLNEIVSKNRKLNNEKANRIINAYRATFLGISILLILALIIGAVIGVR